MKLGNETEGRLLERVFKEGKDLVGGINKDSGSYLMWLAISEEEEWEGGWWLSTLESCLEEDGLSADSNDDLDRFPNVILVDSNLDKIRCMKLES